ncbi:BgTH12-00344 [Blumeria graminis f. sp. triticale]|uniref:peptidylprolyl isomerase n=3 Tax=Blumeria graminis TaxID=34373 RepID=A0A381LGD9_BLUGR|nr:Membrane-bound peptidyl-prolyl cis-trans isomerase (PPIase) [Blumeria graminis f. sp. tritici 96224]CAD6504842.1 BgTH12-00344 [Blumeria graminis f. sp. triticale]VDB92869.1 Bgt-1536 [Blumeria graminis f. sp. tritici]
MHLGAVTLAFLAAIASIHAAKNEVEIQIDHAVECERRSQKGDKVYVHYRGSLKDGGKEFDNSYDRGKPLDFVVGEGHVIQGWDQNLLGMCIGDKRTLTIPPEFGYGDAKIGPIPASSTLVFTTELVGIQGVEAPEAKVSSSTSKIVDKVVESVRAAATEAKKIAETILADAVDGDQEHMEL